MGKGLEEGRNLISEESWLNYFYDLYEELKIEEQNRRRNENQVDEEEDEDDEMANRALEEEKKGITEENWRAHSKDLENANQNSEDSFRKREIETKRLENNGESTKKEKDKEALKTKTENPEEEAASSKVPSGIQVSMAPGQTNPEKNDKSLSFRNPSKNEMEKIQETQESPKINDDPAEKPQTPQAIGPFNEPETIKVIEIPMDRRESESKENEVNYNFKEPEKPEPKLNTPPLKEEPEKIEKIEKLEKIDEEFEDNGPIMKNNSLPPDFVKKKLFEF